MANNFLNATVIYDGFDELVAAVGALPGIVAPDIAESLYSTWYGLASRRLRSSRVRYLAALQPPRSVRGGAAYEITLEGAFPVMVEEGADSYDVGKAILKGQSYQRVPFKQTGANAGFGAKSTPMGYGYRASARGRHPTRGLGGLTDHGVNQALAYPSGARQEAAKVHKAYGSSKGMRDPWRVLGQSGTAMNLGKLRPHHSRPIYAGQVPDTGRKVASGGASTFLNRQGAGGVTFRTVNEDSNWIHPGISARRLSIAGLIVSRHVERL